MGDSSHVIKFRVPEESRWLVSLSVCVSVSELKIRGIKGIAERLYLFWCEQCVYFWNLLWIWMSVISVKLNIEVSKLANKPKEEGNMDGKHLHSNGPNYALAGLRCTRTPPVTNHPLVSGVGYGSHLNYSSVKGVWLTEWRKKKERIIQPVFPFVLQMMLFLNSESGAWSLKMNSQNTLSFNPWPET